MTDSERPPRTTDLGLDLTIALQRYRDERYRRNFSEAEINDLIDRLASREAAVLPERPWQEIERNPAGVGYGTDSEQTPRTAAGRRFLQEHNRRSLYDDLWTEGILAIEAEAAALAERAGLDAERLAEALLRVGDAMQLCATFEAMAEMLIAEYDRVAEYAALTAPTSEGE